MNGEFRDSIQVLDNAPNASQVMLGDLGNLPDLAHCIWEPVVFLLFVLQGI